MYWVAAMHIQMTWTTCNLATTVHTYMKMLIHKCSWTSCQLACMHTDFSLILIHLLHTCWWNYNLQMFWLWCILNKVSPLAAAMVAWRKLRNIWLKSLRNSQIWIHVTKLEFWMKSIMCCELNLMSLLIL